jgi:hypothetical protein
VKLSPKIFLPILGIGLLTLSAEPTPQPAPSAAPEDFQLPVPVGMPVNGIKVPHYNADGRLELVLEAEKAQKTDETTVEFDKLKLEALDDEGRKIFVELPRAKLNLETRILTGDESALIRREDFTVTGDRIEFNTQSRFGTLRGNIRMILSSENTTP